MEGVLVGFKEKEGYAYKAYAPPQPGITSLLPVSGDQGNTLDVVITGTDFVNIYSVSFGSEITVDSFVVDSETQITAAITIPADATLGDVDVMVVAEVGAATLEDGFEITAAAGELTLQVASDNDDFRRVDGAFQLTPPVLRAGATHQVGLWDGMGLRFLNALIPKGATILEAYLIVTCYKASTDACQTRISAEAEDNPSDFSGDDAGSAETRWINSTVAEVEWDFLITDAWTLDAEYHSPELKTIIQELVDRAGWASGNAIVLFWNDWNWETPQGTNKYRQTYPYNVSSVKAVKLYIRW